jgi:hypothetical protein
MQALYGLPETRIYDYIGFLRDVSELVTLNPPIERTHPRRERRLSSSRRR